MTQHPTPGPAVEAARRLWQRTAPGHPSDADVVRAAELLHGELRAGLKRWVGGEGFRALLDRALHLAELEHPILGTLAFLGSDEHTDVPPNGAEVSAGMIALVANLIELLGRIVGDDLALTLVERVTLPSLPSDAPHAARGSTDG